MESWRAFRDSKSRVRYVREVKETEEKFVLPLWITIPFIIAMLPIIFVEVRFLWEVM